MASSSHVTDSTCQNALIATMGQQQEGLKKRKGRGKTTGTSVSKKREKTASGKLHVLIPPDKMVAVGPGAPDFVTEISVLVQKKAPLNVEKWKDVPDEIKKDIVSRVYVNLNIIITIFFLFCLYSLHNTYTLFIFQLLIAE